MKIFFVGDRWGVGGGTSGQLLLAARGLAARGHELTVAVRRVDAPEEAGIVVRQIPWALPRLGRGFLDGYLERLRRPTRAVMSWIRGPSLPGWRAGGGAHEAWIEARDGVVRRRDRHELARERRSADRASIVVVNSALAAQDVLTHLGVSKARIRLVRNGVDLDRFHPSRARSASGRVVIFVGQGWRRKGLRTAIHAFELAASSRDVLWVVASAADLASALAGRSAPDQLRHIEPSPDLPLWLERADVLLHPTLYDSSANVVLEAMACGVVPITSARDGSTEQVDDPALVLSDPTDLASVVERLRYGLAQAEPERWRAVAERWPASRMVEGIEDAMRELEHG